MRIGIDIGGSHIGVGLVDEKGNIILKKEKDLLKENKQNIKEELTPELYVNENFQSSEIFIIKNN